MIDLRKPLAVLATHIPWQELEASVARGKLAEAVDQSSILLQDAGVKPRMVYADMGYRGVDAEIPDYERKHPGKIKLYPSSDGHCRAVCTTFNIRTCVSTTSYTTM